MTHWAPLEASNHYSSSVSQSLPYSSNKYHGQDCHSNTLLLVPTSVLVTIWLLQKDIMKKAIHKREYFIGSLLAVWESPYLIILVGNMVAHKVLEQELRAIFWSAIREERQEILGLVWAFGNLKPHIQWHTSSNRTTRTLTRTRLIIFSNSATPWGLSMWASLMHTATPVSNKTKLKSLFCLSHFFLFLLVSFF